MEVAVAVADLIHIQDSSVLVCLENGWDATAQVYTCAAHVCINKPYDAKVEFSANKASYLYIYIFESTMYINLERKVQSKI